MTPSARMQAAIDCLDLIIAAARDNGAPADAILSNWFKSHRFAGSKDKAAIREIVWEAIRLHGNRPGSGRTAIIGAGREDWSALFDGSTYGPQLIAAGEKGASPIALPDWLDTRRMDWLNEAETAALLGRATFDLRVNAAKAVPADLAEAFPDAQPIPGLPSGLRLDRAINIEASEAYRDGLCEVQDAGSQHVVRIAAARPGETVIDLCAGAGGKTLALAADMAGQGRLIACDTNRARLTQLAPRAARAGADGIEVRLLNPGREMEALADLAGIADLVLVDAPCSGSGTWRRSPDLRWRWTPERLKRVEDTQRHVIALAQQLIRPGGRLVYAVCSIRDEEGADQVRGLDGFDPCDDPQPVGRSRGAGWLFTPHHDQSDGFFVASLSQRC
jgi:16S rRNA (cytosine967-C5)-methyltransferase